MNNYILLNTRWIISNDLTRISLRSLYIVEHGYVHCLVLPFFCWWNSDGHRLKQFLSEITIRLAVDDRIEVYSSCSGPCSERGTGDRASLAFQLAFIPINDYRPPATHDCISIYRSLNNTHRYGGRPPEAAYSVFRCPPRLVRLFVSTGWYQRWMAEIFSHPGRGWSLDFLISSWCSCLFFI